MAILLILLGILATLAGAFLLSDATLGVGLIGLGCFLGILARIGQADAHHKAIKKQLAATATQDPAPTPLTE